MQAIEGVGGSTRYGFDLETVKQSHSDLLASIEKGQKNLHESLGEWRSYEMSLRDVESQLSRPNAIDRSPIHTSNLYDATNKLEQQRVKLASLRQQRKTLSLTHQQCLSRHKSTQVSTKYMYTLQAHLALQPHV